MHPSVISVGPGGARADNEPKLTVVEGFVFEIPLREPRTWNCGLRLVLLLLYI